MKKVLFLLLPLAMSVGCDTIGPAMDTTEDAVTLNYYWEEGSVLAMLDEATLTDEEARTVVGAVATAEEIRARVLGYYSQPEGILEDLPKLEIEYARLTRAYLSVRDIVIDNKSEYSRAAWDRFLLFDKHAFEMHANFTALTASAQANAAMLSTLSYASMLLKILAVM